MAKSRGIGGLREIKTSLKAKLRTAPVNRESGFLDLYVLNMERSRLENEKAAIERRKKNINRSLRGLQKELLALESSVRKKKRTRALKSSKNFRRITLEY